MCIIAIKPKTGQMFSEECIRRMFKNNPDGAGYMFYEDGKVQIRKGFMTVEKLLESLNKHDFTDRNLVLHFRIGTSGLTDGLNTHPYPVFEKNSESCSTNLAMAHNGVLAGYIPMHGSKINDTQNFIQKVLQQLSPDFINNKDVMFLIEKVIGTNRLAFLDDKDNISMLGEFIEDNGCYYSNSSYKPSKPLFYEPVSFFKKTNVLEFGSEKQLDDWLAKKRCIYEIDDDLYEDFDGNFYDVDRSTLCIFVN